MTLGLSLSIPASIMLSSGSVDLITNLVDYSYDSTQWSNTWSGGVTVEYQTVDTTDPQGGSNASKLSRVDGNNDSIYFGSSSLFLDLSTTYLQSIFCKEGTALQTSIDINQFGTGYIARTQFAWNAGVPSVNASDADDAGVILHSDGWYRLYQIFTTQSTGNTEHRPLLIPGFTGGGGANEYIYAWGADIKKASVLTPHVVTNG